MTTSIRNLRKNNKKKIAKTNFLYTPEKKVCSIT